MGDFSKGEVHKTGGFWWVIFQRGKYTKPMGANEFWNVFIASRNYATGAFISANMVFSYYSILRLPPILYFSLFHFQDFMFQIL